MASSQQWHAARNWKLSPWNEELSWDEWYEKVENTLRVQNDYIDSLQEDLRGVNNDVRALTATMNVIANTLSSSSSASGLPPTAVASSASGLPSTAVALAHWPSPNPADHQPQRPCHHGMKDQFFLPFTVADHSEFHAFHDQNEMAWRDLQSLAQKNNMLSSLLESRFKNCDGLRIQRYGKRTQTVRCACIHCRCCTGEIMARKGDDYGQTVLSESNDDIAFLLALVFL